MLAGAERAVAALPGGGRRLRQFFTRLAPVHAIPVRGLILKAILPLHQVGTWNEFRAWPTREPEVLDWIDGFTPPFTFLDVGANFGTESLYCAKRHPGGRVIACDPEFLGGYNLAVNLLLNDLANVENYAVALGAAPGWLEIGENLNYLHVLPGRKYAQATRRVRLESIDGLLAGRSITHLKIDVDGMEGAILDGATTTLADPALRSAMIEVDDPAARDGVTDRLRGFGFEPSGRSGPHGNNLAFRRPMP